MPGIYGAAGAGSAGLPEAAIKMFGEVSSCRDMRHFNLHPMHAANFSGFSLNNKMFADLKTPYEDGDILVLFDGNVFNLHEIGLSGLTYAEAAARSFREKGEKFAAGFRGHFVIALLEKRRKILRVYADAVAAKPVYYMHHGGVFYFAAELKALLPVGPLPKRLDREHFCAEDLRALHEQRWSEETLLADVKTRLDMAVMRSKRVHTVLLEYFGHLVAHNLVKLAMLRAAVRHEADLLRLSYTASLRILNELNRSVAYKPALYKEAIAKLHKNIALEKAPQRSGRSEPRKRRPERKPYPIFSGPRKEWRQKRCRSA